VHTSTGKELDRRIHAWRSIRYVGWSPRPDEKFFFQYRFTGPSYLTEQEKAMQLDDPRRLQAMQTPQEIRVEVWFHGQEARKLLETIRVLTPEASGAGRY
jgi:hypothetical protein